MARFAAGSLPCLASLFAPQPSETSSLQKLPVNLRRGTSVQWTGTILVFLFASICSAWAAQADRTTATIENNQVAPLISGRIDDRNLVTLRGNTRPEANAKNDRGRVADDFRLDHMILQLRRSPAQEQALEQYIDELHDPASPHFHQWLTAEQLGEKYGVAQADIDKITGWLKLHGFSVNPVAPSHMTIDFSGTAGQVRRAFHTEIHKLQVDGVDHIANMRDPRIPAALAPAVAGIVSLNDFRPHPMHEPRANYTFSGSCGLATACYILVPADLATIYNLNPLFTSGYSGQGQTIVVIEDTDVYSTSDWDTFRSTFGLSTNFPAGSFTQVHPNSGNNCTDPGVNPDGDDGEATLDAEWASAAAPSAAIELASCSSTTTPGQFIALQNLLNGSSPPAIVSISYGAPETDDGAAGNAFISAVYQQAAGEGVSVFVSAGDAAGALSDQGCTVPCEAQHGINVNGWGSTVYNVAVGGTDFGDTYSGTNSTYWGSTNTSTYGSALSYIPEIPWNDSCASVLLATFVSGSGVTYGTSGFCNSAPGGNFLNVAGGSGGPSACATGTPSVPGVVSSTCAGYAKPSWQSVFGNPSDGVRDLPDVSLFAANGIWGHSYVYCFSDPSNGGRPCTGAPSSWSLAGGTSFASPIMAAIQSLVNQYTGTTWGNPNPTYYSLAASEYGTSGDTTCNSSNGNGVSSSCIFYDVTQGDMDVPCVANSGTLYNCYLPSGTYGVLSTSNSAYQPAYGTHSGWDFATGIGTVNAYNLVVNFKPKTSTTTTASVTPNSVNIGATSPVTLAVTVKPSSGSGTPTGTVTFFNGTTQIGQPVTLSNGSASLSYNVSSLVAQIYSITATYSGDNTFAASTSSAQNLNVQDFTVAANPTTVTVTSPGQSAETIITITPLGGFNETLNYTCSGLPSESTCTFAAVSSTGETLTIQTTAPSARLDRGRWRSDGGLFYAFLLPGFFGFLTGKSGRRTTWRTIALAVAIGLALLIPSCGGSSSSTPTNPGTPTGTTQVTVTATTAGTSALSHQIQLTLTVQ